MKGNVDWISLPFELWDYVFRYHVVDEYDALRLAQTCTALWEVYKSNGVKEWAWRNRWTREVKECRFINTWTGARRCSDDKKEGTWRISYDKEPFSFEQHWVDGKMHGLSRSWYDDGQLHWEEHWVNGKRHGLRRWWYRNGVIDYEKNWVHRVEQ